MKTAPRRDAQLLGQRLRQEGKRIVFTNGCFDVLHVGHTRYLQQARALGDILVVGVNSDASTRALKGPARPLVPEEERAEVLSALACVDYVIVFDELTAEALVEELRPDIYVKGGDYAPDPGRERWHKLPEARIVTRYGGQVVIVPLVEGRSTSGLVERVLESYRQRGEAAE